MSYPAMRRQDRLLTEDEAMEILKKCEYGVLSVLGPDGVPYGVPLSHVVDGRSIVFHCAKSGYKNDALMQQPMVCFTVVGDNELTGLTGFSLYYESAIACGRAVRVEDRAEKLRLIRVLTERFFPHKMDAFDQRSEESLLSAEIFRIDIEQLSGKANRAPQ